MKKISVILLSFMLLQSGITSVYAQGISDSSVSFADNHGKKNILMVNPIHLAFCNFTFSYLRFIGKKESYVITVSGSEKENYISISADLNYYPAPPSAINYFIGASILGYESPIKTGVPIAGPLYKFFESKEDGYYAGLQMVNGCLFRISERVSFIPDGRIGMARNLSAGEWLAIWSVNVNLGISF